MNNIIKEIHYCTRHARYSPISIYAGDELFYSSSCPICHDELTNVRTVPRPKKTANSEVPVIEPLKQTPLPSRNS